MSLDFNSLSLSETLRNFETINEQKIQVFLPVNSEAKSLGAISEEKNEKNLKDPTDFFPPIPDRFKNRSLRRRNNPLSRKPRKYSLLTPEDFQESKINFKGKSITQVEPSAIAQSSYRNRFRVYNVNNPLQIHHTTPEKFVETHSSEKLKIAFLLN